jgi:hypothetical protein
LAAVEKNKDTAQGRGANIQMELIVEDNEGGSYLMMGELDDMKSIANLDINKLRQQIQAIDEQDKDGDGKVIPC